MPLVETGLILLLRLFIITFPIFLTLTQLHINVMLATTPPWSRRPHPLHGGDITDFCNSRCAKFDDEHYVKMKHVINTLLAEFLDAEKLPIVGVYILSTIYFCVLFLYLNKLTKYETS